MELDPKNRTPLQAQWKYVLYSGLDSGKCVSFDNRKEVRRALPRDLLPPEMYSVESPIFAVFKDSGIPMVTSSCFEDGDVGIEEAAIVKKIEVRKVDMVTLAPLIDLDGLPHYSKEQRNGIAERALEEALDMGMKYVLSVEILGYSTGTINQRSVVVRCAR